MSQTRQRLTQLLSNALLNWYKKGAKPYAWRLLWNQSHDPYPVILSEIMLQQTTLAVVVPAFTRVIQKFPTAADLANADEKEIRSAFAGLGYYNRFFRLQKALQIVVKQGWPLDLTSWRALPGIGPYTSGILASIVNDAAIPAIDGNVERVAARFWNLEDALGSLSLKRKCEELLQPVLRDSPHGARGDFNQAMMELGQSTCTPRSPLCEACPIAAIGCYASTNQKTDVLPTPKERPTFKEIELHVHCVEKDGRILLKRRDHEDRFLRNSTGFPMTAEPPLMSKKVGTFHHTITNHKIRATLWLRKPTQKEKAEFVSISFRDIQGELTTSFDQKAAKLLTSGESLTFH